MAKKARKKVAVYKAGVAHKRFLSPEALLAGAKEAADIAAEQKVRLILVGGIAMHHYGSDRLTGDVDVAVGTTLRGFPPCQPLSFGGTATTTPSGVPMDMIVRSDDYEDLFLEAIAAARKVPGLPAPVVSAEHLAAMKMVAGRDKDEGDLKFLLGSGLVDMPKARRIIKRHLGPYAAQEFDRIVDEVEWRNSRNR